jgi:hypothetical protein
MNGPAILTEEEVVFFLRDMANGFESGGTDEGSIEILLPPYTASKDYYENHMSPEEQSWYEPSGSEYESEHWRLKKDAPHDRYLVRASYRIGRDMGQGGVRLINDSTWKSKPADWKPPSDPPARL